jgi:hypothetical protein
VDQNSDKDGSCATLRSAALRASRSIHHRSDAGTLNGLAQAIKDSSSLRHVIASPVFGVEDKIGVDRAVGRLCPPVVKALSGNWSRKTVPIST